MQIYSAANSAINYANNAARVSVANLGINSNNALSDEAAAKTASINTRNPSTDGVLFTPIGEAQSATKAGLYSNVGASPSSSTGANNAKPSDVEAQAAKQQEIEKKKEQAELDLIQKQISALSARDKEVRAHEQAHVAAGGRYAGAAKYTYERGPDGVSYAVGGEVPIDVSPAATPQETIEKAQVVKRAALAPAEPSPQDRKVASLAGAMEQQARAELAEQNAQEQALARSENATDSSANNEAAPQGDSNTFEGAQSRAVNNTDSSDNIQSNPIQSSNTISSSGFSSLVTQNNLSTLLAIQSNQPSISTINTRV